MSTYDKNIHYLKEAIFSKLNNSSDLATLLGGSGRIYHRQPPNEAKYPCLIYSIINDTDNVFNEDRSTGEVTRAFIRISIFSKSKKTEESDNIEAKVKSLLHGQRTLDTTKIICYSCYRDNLLEPRRDPDDKIWITQTRYRTSWAVK
jgi:hypothetical protein